MEQEKKISAIKDKKISGGWGGGGGGTKAAVEFEMLSPGWMLFIVNGEIECVAYLMGLLFYCTALNN